MDIEKVALHEKTHPTFILINYLSDSQSLILVLPLPALCYILICLPDPLGWGKLYKPRGSELFLL